jgi:hypothetical protein
LTQHLVERIFESTGAHMTDFDFDEWSELFSKDPAEFERRRAAVLESVIRTAPVEMRAKLRMLQMECDGIRQAMPALDAAKEMSKMMTDKVFELQDSMLDLAIAVKNFDDQRKS